ncbi:MAG: P1 family peptidase [Candidatus Sumerlaeia bacterium]|nr:P1 family peptidase [Candidatus Sumerlaeia bacterium]
MRTRLACLALLALLIPRVEAEAPMSESPRPRARDLGIEIGILPPGPNNAITDVAGVLVGHATVVRGEDVRTGVTAILPHDGNLFREKVPAAVHVGNGFGKLMGSTQVAELGELETPILLTSTLSVARTADALLDWMLALPGNEAVRSINPLVGETNDGFLNESRGRHVGQAEVFAALSSAAGGPVAEGSVGAGTGTMAFGFKGGIGTASRVLPASLGGYTVGVLVQSNFAGVLTIAGAPVGRELGRYAFKEQVEARPEPPAERPPDGSIMMVVATDAPLDARNLERLAARTMMGLGRTGSYASNGSGDYAIAFSTAPQNRILSAEGVRSVELLGNQSTSALFLAVVEATEEAVINSVLRATTVVGREGNRGEALPIERTVEILEKYGVVTRKP